MQDTLRVLGRIGRGKNTVLKHLRLSSTVISTMKSCRFIAVADLESNINYLLIVPIMKPMPYFFLLAHRLVILLIGTGAERTPLAPPTIDRSRSRCYL